eukprot:CAMPEP_0119319480 /NCGR_PEP_ID=MMETSP1333-20130426/49518_1 /TAXON_ID=418940 /ORGANISM="Scyphosphaera apsteinii, Strain RCC1455" /LENGTH=48 /DNA_ID= /DNA_START= /DNA_END= /DNA_ORIENTATION=
MTRQACNKRRTEASAAKWARLNLRCTWTRDALLVSAHVRQGTEAALAR